MTYPDTGYLCMKCTMRFHIGIPSKGSRGTGEWQKCPEKGCGLRFYAGRMEKQIAIRCCVDPKDLPRIPCSACEGSGYG